MGCQGDVLAVMIRLEVCTERSESNPGRSLGDCNEIKKTVWKTVP